VWQSAARVIASFRRKRGNPLLRAKRGNLILGATH